VIERISMISRTVIAVVGCFAGSLASIAFADDRKD
jgi:hypothetical protein